eukprot:11437729-Prorocentrum_lima.AAC.1
MTSSLVGSEMCIRDRHHALQEVLQNVRAIILESKEPEVQIRAWELFIAVSYTHLTLPTICSV